MGNKSSLMLRDEEIQKLSDETGFSPSQIEKLYSRFAHLDRSNLGSLSKGDLLSIPELAINPLCDRLIQMFFTEYDEGNDERINFRQFVTVLAAFRSSSSPNNNHHRSTHSRTTPKDLNNNDSNSTAFTSANRPLNGQHQQHSSNTEPADVSQANSHHQLLANHTKKPPTVSDPLMNERLRDKLLFVFRIYDADNDGKISFGDLRSILKMMVGNYIEDVQLDKIATRAFVEVDQDSDGFIEFDEFCRVFAGKDLDDKLRVRFFS